MTDDPWAERDGSSPTTRGYREMLDDPFADLDSKRQTMADSAIGHAATLLFQRGDREVVELLLDAELIIAEYDDQYQDWDIVLEVSPEHHSRFTEDHIGTIRAAVNEICTRLKYFEFGVIVRETLPPAGPSWRDQLREQFTSKRRPTNQGRRVRTGPPRFREDWLAFTNDGELTVYRALRQIQEKDLPSDSTIGIYPLAGGRIPGKTWEPDFLVTYKGRAGVLEVDGPHHNQRRALDTTRDHLLRDAGIAFVDRMPVEVVDDPAELNAVLRRFLRRLSETQ